MGTKSHNAQEGEAFFKMELSPVKPSGASGGGAQEGGALTAESRRWGLLRATRRRPSEASRGRTGGRALFKIELSPAAPEKRPQEEAAANLLRLLLRLLLTPCSLPLLLLLLLTTLLTARATATTAHYHAPAITAHYHATDP